MTRSPPRKLVISTSFSMGSELQPIGVEDLRVESGRHPLRRNIDDGERAILCIRCPQLAPVVQDIETFVAFAHGNNGLIPVHAWLSPARRRLCAGRRRHSWRKSHRW